MITGIVKTFKTGDYSVTRTNAGSYTDGVYTPGSNSVFLIEASVGPLSGKQLMVLPEGRRMFEHQALFTTTELRNNSVGDVDVVTIDGEPWAIFSISKWKRNQLFEVIIARQVTQ